MDMSEIPLASRLRGTLRLDEPMAKHVSWRAGGAARVFYVPASVPDLCLFLRTRPDDEPLLFVGLGSNLLVRDGGFPGAVVMTHHALTGIEPVLAGKKGSDPTFSRATEKVGSDPTFPRPTFYAGSGVPLPHLARFATKHGAGGGEWMAGVPGTVGGALAMNAGCYGCETWDHVIAAETVDRHGNLRLRTPTEYSI